MNRKEYVELSGTLFQNRMDLGSKKSKDYADHDVLSNFKRISVIADILNLNVYEPHGYALFMALMKMDRIVNLINQGTEPNNESMDDSFMDFMNYLDLARAILIEEQNAGEENKVIQ